MASEDFRILANGIFRRVQFKSNLKREYPIDVICNEVNFREENYTGGLYDIIKRDLITLIVNENQAGLGIYSAYFTERGKCENADIEIQFSPHKNQIKYSMKTENFPIRRPTDDEIKSYGGKLMADLIEGVEVDNFFSL